jgi:hypothetical protein
MKLDRHSPWRYIMDAIDLGCRSFFTLVLFAIILTLGYFALFGSGFPDLPYWLAIAVYFLTDIVIASIYFARGKAEVYLRHSKEIFPAGSLGTAIALLGWGLHLGVGLTDALVVALVALVVLGLFRAVVYKEAMIISGVAFQFEEIKK